MKLAVRNIKASRIKKKKKRRKIKHAKVLPFVAHVCTYTYMYV